MTTISIITPWSGNTGAMLLPDYAAAVGASEVITVDNASHPETAEALAKCGGVYIRNETNEGFAGGNNQGYARATGDIIIFLNSDVAPSGPWLEMVAADVRDGALYGPSLAQQLVAGRWLPYLEGWCVAATKATWERLREAPSELAAFLPGVSSKVMVGPWDADSYPGPYWEDNDLCLRAAQAGIALVQTAWPIQHKGGRTAGPIMRHAASFAANERTYTDRVLAALGERTPQPTPVYQRYLQECATQSDIQHHLPLLYSLARGTIVELGTRGGVSTAAFLAGVEARKGEVWSIDIDPACGELYKGHPQWQFIHGSSLDEKVCDFVTRGGIPNAPKNGIDLLFIDTEHTFDQAAAELALWAEQVRPGGYILMHDPETFPGVRRAAQEFADARGWTITFVRPCNGMAVIVRPSDG
jgi:cephalosporin hydroxylase